MSACTFFGHKESYPVDTIKLQHSLEILIEKGVDIFYVGHQGSFDKIVYQTLRRLRQRFSHIQIYIVLAYPPGEKAPFMDMSDTLSPPIEAHPKFAIDRRNYWMIENSAYCICYINNTWGGAYKFSKIAQKRGLTMINLGSSAMI